MGKQINKERITLEHWKEWSEPRRREMPHPTDEEVEDYMRSRFRSSGNRLLQILVMPSLAPQVCYEIYEEYHYAEEDDLDAESLTYEVQYKLVRTTWSHLADDARWETNDPPFQAGNVAPTIDIEDRYVDSETVGEVIVAFKQVKVPLWLDDHGIGLKDTLYELAMGDRWRGTRYNWWDGAGGEWKPIINVTLEMVNKLNALFGDAPEDAEDGADDDA